MRPGAGQPLCPQAPGAAALAPAPSARTQTHGRQESPGSGTSRENHAVVERSAPAWLRLLPLPWGSLPQSSADQTPPPTSLGSGLGGSGLVPRVPQEAAGLLPGCRCREARLPSLPQLWGLHGARHRSASRVAARPPRGQPGGLEGGPVALSCRTGHQTHLAQCEEHCRGPTWGQHPRGAPQGLSAQPTRPPWPQGRPASPGWEPPSQCTRAMPGCQPAGPAGSSTSSLSSTQRQGPGTTAAGQTYCVHIDDPESDSELPLVQKRLIHKTFKLGLISRTGK